MSNIKLILYKTTSLCTTRAYILVISLSKLSTKRLLTETFFDLTANLLSALAANSKNEPDYFLCVCVWECWCFKCYWFPLPFCPLYSHSAFSSSKGSLSSHKQFTQKKRRLLSLHEAVNVRRYEPSKESIVSTSWSTSRAKICLDNYLIVLHS